MSWEEHALCARVGSPQDWFPKVGDHATLAAAVEVCNQCPVRTPCLEDDLALPAADQHGVRGGMGPVARREELQRRRTQDRTLVPALGAVRRVQALAAAGHGRQVLMEDGRISRYTVTKLRSGHLTTIRAHIHQAVTAAYQAWAGVEASGPRAPDRRHHARRQGWAPPEAWVGADLDDPAARPRPVHETATTVAADPRGTAALVHTLHEEMTVHG